MNKYFIKLKLYEPQIKNYILISFLPFLVMSIFVLVPSFIGISIVIGEYPFDEIEPLTGEDKQLINDFYLVLFNIYPLYLFGEIFALLFLLLLVGSKK